VSAPGEPVGAGTDQRERFDAHRSGRRKIELDIPPVGSSGNLQGPAQSRQRCPVDPTDHRDDGRIVEEDLGP
jgi:hypothetical protein